MQLYQIRNRCYEFYFLSTCTFSDLTFLCHYLIDTENSSGEMDGYVTSATSKGESMNHPSFIEYGCVLLDTKIESVPS